MLHKIISLLQGAAPSFQQPRRAVFWHFNPLSRDWTSSPSVAVEGMKRLLCQVLGKHEPILNLSHQQYVIAAAWHFKTSPWPIPDPARLASLIWLWSVTHSLCATPRWGGDALFGQPAHTCVGVVCSCRYSCCCSRVAATSLPALTYTSEPITLRPLCKLSCAIRIPPRGQCRSTLRLIYATGARPPKRDLFTRSCPR